MITTKMPKHIERARATYALLILPKELCTDVLTDGELIARYELALDRPINLGESYIPRDALFSAFRELTDSGQNIIELPKGLLRQSGSGKRDATPAMVELDGDHAAVTLRQTRFRFEGATMLSADPQRRAETLRRELKLRSLCAQDVNALFNLVSHPNWDYDKFISVLTILASAPETFVESFSSATKTGRIAAEDLLPTEIRHWDHLAGVWQQSHTLDEYVAHELKQERDAQLERGAQSALSTISLTYASPAFIGKGMLDCFPEHERNEAIRQLSHMADPFSLIGALHYCAEYRLLELGREVLDKLFADMDRLNSTAQMFGACFVVATAAIAQSSVLGRRPPFWRRLTAHAHASLIVRTAGGPKASQQSLFDWAMVNSGTTFISAALRDFVDEPRWRPDWIVSTNIVADLCGRALGIVKAPGQDVPSSWHDSLRPAEKWLEENHAHFMAHYPAPIEGARREASTMAELGELGQRFQEVLDAGEVKDFVAATALVNVLSAPSDLEALAIQIVRKLGQYKTIDDRGLERAALALAAYIAALLRSEALADAAAEATFSLLELGDEFLQLPEAVMRLLECNSAYRDRTHASLKLAGQLEALAFGADDTDDLSRLLSFVRSLQAVDPNLEGYLGKAIAIADLGAGRLRS